MKKGALLAALSPQSAYAAKKNGLWPELMDRLTDCVLPQDIDAFERYVVSLGLKIPAGWHTEIAEIVEKRREEIAEDDISTIMLHKYNF